MPTLQILIVYSISLISVRCPDTPLPSRHFSVDYCGRKGDSPPIPLIPQTDPCAGTVNPLIELLNREAVKTLVELLHLFKILAFGLGMAAQASIHSCCQATGKMWCKCSPCYKSAMERDARGRPAPDSIEGMGIAYSRTVLERTFAASLESGIVAFPPLPSNSTTIQVPSSSSTPRRLSN